METGRPLNNKSLCPDTSGRCLDRQNVNRTATAIAPPHTRFPSSPTLTLHLSHTRYVTKSKSPAPHHHHRPWDSRSKEAHPQSHDRAASPTAAAVAVAAFLAGISSLDGLLRHRLLLLAAEHPPWTLATCPSRSPLSSNACTASSMRSVFPHMNAIHESQRFVLGILQVHQQFTDIHRS